MADMVANNDRLSWDSFTHLLPMQVIMVLPISPPTDMKEDSMIKRHSPNGNFTVSSAHDILRDMLETTLLLKGSGVPLLKLETKLVFGVCKGHH